MTPPTSLWSGNPIPHTRVMVFSTPHKRHAGKWQIWKCGIITKTYSSRANLYWWIDLLLCCLFASRVRGLGFSWYLNQLPFTWLTACCWNIYDYLRLKHLRKCDQSNRSKKNKRFRLQTRNWALHTNISINTLHLQVSSQKFGMSKVKFAGKTPYGLTYFWNVVCHLHMCGFLLASGGFAYFTDVSILFWFKCTTYDYALEELRSYQTFSTSMSNGAVRAGYHENCILKRLVLILMSLNGYCQEHVSVLDQKNRRSQWEHTQWQLNRSGENHLESEIKTVLVTLLCVLVGVVVFNEQTTQPSTR